MNMSLSLALLIAGIVFMLFGLSSADSIANALSRLFSGHFTDRTMWLIVGGGFCAVVGLVGCYRRLPA